MKLSSNNKKYVVGEIPIRDKELFAAIRDPEFNNFALMRVKFNEYETSCIISVNTEITKDSKLKVEGKYILKPLAILVNDDILKHFKILCPYGDQPN